MKYLLGAMLVFGVGYLATHIIVTNAMSGYKEPLRPQDTVTTKLGDIVTEDKVWRLQPTEPVQPAVDPTLLEGEL